MFMRARMRIEKCRRLILKFVALLARTHVYIAKNRRYRRYKALQHCFKRGYDEYLL